MRKLCAVLLLVAAFGRVDSEACTSAVISGKARPDGRPVMFKHRDSPSRDNAIERFRGEKYSFIGLVNAEWKEKVGQPGFPWPEVWAGVNEVGFCIMNTAAYDFNNDDVPLSRMDREGILMYRTFKLWKHYFK